MDEMTIFEEQDIDHGQLLNQVPNPLFLSNMEGRLIYVNEAAAAMGIFSNKLLLEMQGTGLERFSSVEMIYKEITAGEKLVLSFNDRKYTFHISAFTFLSTAHYLFSLSKMEDITGNDSRNVVSQSEFNNLRVEEIEDYAILMLSLEGNIINGNKGLKTVKGYEIGDVIGRHFETFYPEEDLIKGLPQKMLQNALIYGKAAAEGWRKRKGGSLFWANIVISPVHDSEGETIGFTKVTRDFTEKKLAEDEREQQASTIAAKNRQLEEFAAITSHDLQEPLRKIQMFSQLIETNIGDSAYVSSYLLKISNTAARMRSLIEDILEYARVIEAAGDKQEVDLGITIDGVLDDFELLIAERKVTVSKHAAFPSVHAVPVQMRQLFTNIIGNAIKFSHGDPKVDINCSVVNISNSSSSLTPGNYFSISISDNGIGFDQKYASEIFKPFKRLKTDVRGSGIGLAVCHKIVSNHNGDIEVLSKINEGTTFTILLPVSKTKS